MVLNAILKDQLNNNNKILLFHFIIIAVINALKTLYGECARSTFICCVHMMLCYTQKAWIHSCDCHLCSCIILLSANTQNLRTWYLKVISLQENKC